MKFSLLNLILIYDVCIYSIPGRFLQCGVNPGSGVSDRTGLCFLPIDQSLELESVSQQ